MPGVSFLLPLSASTESDPFPVLQIVGKAVLDEDTFFSRELDGIYADARALHEGQFCNLVSSFKGQCFDANACNLGIAHIEDFELGKVICYGLSAFVICGCVAQVQVGEIPTR